MSFFPVERVKALFPIGRTRCADCGELVCRCKPVGEIKTSTTGGVVETTYKLSTGILEQMRVTGLPGPIPSLRAAMQPPPPPMGESLPQPMSTMGRAPWEKLPGPPKLPSFPGSTPMQPPAGPPKAPWDVSPAVALRALATAVERRGMDWMGIVRSPGGKELFAALLGVWERLVASSRTAPPPPPRGDNTPKTVWDDVTQPSVIVDFDAIDKREGTRVKR